MSLTVDLNCDLGESFGVYKLGMDEDMMKLVSSVNIACGFHAGDPLTIMETVKLAIANKVCIGAHPGFADLRGFGRREIQITPREVYAETVYQIGALMAFVTAEGGKMTHVKPHGALYNMVARDQQIAEAIAEAVYQVDPNLRLFGLSGSKLISAGKKIGLQTVNEVFADRTYLNDGTLVPREFAGAVIKTTKFAVEQVLSMIKYQRVTTLDQEEVAILPETVCLHGDGSQALMLAQHIKEALNENNIKIQGFYP